MASKKKGSTPASQLQAEILKQGQPVSAEVAGVLEGEYNRVTTSTQEGEEISQLVIEPGSAETGNVENTQELFQALDAAEAQLRETETPVVETPTTPEIETMENVTEQVNETVQQAVEAAQPEPGMFRRGWNWTKQNKGKIALGAAAVVGVGVGVYYLVRTGNASKATEAAAAVVTTVAETTTEAVA